MPLLRGSCFLLALALAACGVAGAGDPPPPSLFPAEGPGPHRLLTDDELPADAAAPYLLLAPGLALDHPTAVRVGADRLFLAFTASDARESRLGQAVLRGLGVDRDVSTLLAPEAAWEGRALSRPTLLVAGGDLPAYLLLYQGEDGAVGLARAAAADGLPGDFARVGAQPLVPTRPGIGATSGALREDGLVVYQMQDGAEVRALFTPRAALRAFIDGAGAPPSFEDRGVVLRAGALQVGRSSSKLVPAERLRSLGARVATTAAGRPRYELYLAAAQAAADAPVFLCAAASFDGLAYLPIEGPVLSATLGGNPDGATAVASPLPPEVLGPSLLLIGWQGTRQGLVAARRP